MVSQKSSFFCIPRTSPVNTRRSKATSFSKTSFPCKNLQRPPFIREGETIYKKFGKIIKRSSCVEHSSWISNFFHRTPLSTSLPVGGKITTEEKELTEEEINQMLEKGAIIKLDPSSSDQFLSSIFTVSKKDGGDRPVINLKKLNSLIHCPHLKMKGLFLVRELLSPNDWMYKKNLKDVYFSRLIHRNSLNNMRFEWQGSLYQFLWLYFGLFQAPLVFTKLLKVPVVFYNI